MKVIALRDLRDVPLSLEYLHAIKVSPNLEVENYHYINTPHGHLLYSIKGDANYIYKGTVTNIRPGALYYIPTGSDPHFNEDESYEYIKVYFKLTSQEDGDEIVISDEITELYSQVTENLRQELFSICYALSNDSLSVFGKYSLFFSLMEHIYIEREKSPKPLALAISPAITHLQHNFQYDFSTAHLAEMCSLSESYFRKLFRETMHASPTEYRNFLRINYACNQLATAPYTVSKISDLSGFDNISHFYRTFKHFMGVSPTEYKKRFTGRHTER